jgi:PAS domain S-box-containing protein
MVAFQSLWVRKDGRKARIAWRAALIRGGDTRLIVATGQETTRGRRAARDFAETEARYETLLDLLPEAVVVHQEGRAVFVNRAAAELYADGDPQAMLGRPVFDFVVPDEREATLARVAQMVRDGKPIEFRRERHQRLDGAELQVEVSASPVQFDGRPAVEVVARDIGEQLATRVAQASSEARIRAIFDDSSIGMLLVDRSGRALESNAAFHRLLGFTPAELERLTVADYTHPGDREVSESMLEDLFAGRIDQYEIEKRYIRKDGSEIWTRVHVAPVRNAAGETAMAVGTVEDITSHQQLMAQLNQASKMEALGRLAGGVAHDFNNLLTVVNGYADLLATSLEGDERLADAMEIRRAGARAVELTAQLLAFGRRAARAAESIPLNERIEQMVPMLRRLLGEAIDFDVRLDQRIGCVEADPSQLDQVVMNLVVNGRDAMPSGGRLRLTSRLIDRPAGEDRPARLSWARIEIEDSGFGIEPEIIDRIFEPFFTTKVSGRGTGLGLATVYGIVQQMGGLIRVESKVGVGTTFQVELPLTETADGRTVQEPDDSSPHGTETILLVEDEAAVREFCKRALEAEGYRVVASGPREAVGHAEALGESLDLLLSDVVMPDPDGPTIAAALTSRRPGLRVLFMSGYPRDHEAEFSGAAAAGTVLGKPFDARQLAEAVRKVLDRP